VRQILEGTVGRAEAQPSALTSTLDTISQRLTVEGREDPEARLFLGLRQRYPGPEVGLVFSLLMNHMRLAPGEAIFIPAGVPHAYLFGDIVECMANSDNVVRAGLTGKHRDRETLLAVLSDELGPPPTIGASPQPMQKYRTPAAEFEVWRLRADGSPRPMLTGERPEMLLVTAGEAIASWDGRSSGRICLARGESALVPACLACYTLDIEAGAEIFRATVPRGAS
jgi:mannose-6-phosphate isomerase